MKSRRWILVPLMLFVLWAAASLALRFSGLSEVVNAAVLNHMRPLLGDNASVESVELHLGGVILHELQYEDSTKGLAFSALRVRLNWNPFNIVVYGFNLLNIVDEVTADKWEFAYFKPAYHQSKKPPIVGSSPEKQHYWELINRFPAFRMISLRNGAGRLPNVNLSNIDCWIDLNRNDSLAFDLSASYLSSDNNLRVKGSIKPNNKNIDAEVTILGVELDKIADSIPGIRINDGELNAAVEFKLAEKTLTINGGVEALGLSADYKNVIDLKDADFLLKFTGDSATVDGTMDFLGMPAEFFGNAHNLTNTPSFSLKFYFPEVETRKILSKLNAGDLFVGAGELSMGISGDMSSLNFDIYSYSPHIQGQTFELNDLILNGNYHDKLFNLKELKFDYQNGEVLCAGDIDLTTSNPYLNLKADYQGIPDLNWLDKSLKGNISEFVEINCNIVGPVMNPAAKGLYRFKPTGDFPWLKGEIHYEDTHLSVTEFSGAGDSIGFEVRFDEEKPLFSVSGIDIQKIIPANLLPSFARENNVRFNIFAGGDFDKFDLFCGARNNQICINLDAEIHSGERISADGGYEIVVGDSMKTNGDIALSYYQNTIDIEEFTAGADLYASGSFNLKDKYINRLSLKADDMDVDSLLFFTGFNKWNEFDGKLKLDIEASGPFTSPDALFSAYLSSGSFFGKTGYWGSLSGDMRNNRLSLTGMDFGNKGNMLFSAEGVMDLNNNEIDFSSVNENVDFDLLFNSLSGKKGICTGAGNFYIRAGGTLFKPQVDGGFNIEMGSVYGLSFDQSSGVFTYIIDENGGYLEIPSLSLTRTGDYEIAAGGKIPFSEKVMDFSINAEGNLLSAFAGQNKFITSAEGNGVVDIELGGSLRNPTLKSARADLQDCAVNLSKVTNRIANLNLHSVLEDSFIHIYNLSGTIDDAPFRIQNFSDVENPTIELKPWIIGSSGLSLGIITLETGKEGLKLSIPAFCPEDEYAKLSVFGRNPDEKAYIAGPEEHPVVRANMIVKDGVISYPPPKKAKDPHKKKSVITRLLEKIRWDLDVIPDRGNSYERDMAAVEGSQFAKDLSGLFSRVNVDMEIDRQLAGLSVRGSIADTTFRLSGGFVSTRGVMNVLDMDFNVQEFKIEFDPADNRPYVEGYATTIQRDSLGQDRTIVLRVVNIDPVTGEKTYRARWGDFTFTLEDEYGDSQEQILTLLGYSPDLLTDKAYSMPLKGVDNAVFGDWLGKLEREIRNVLGVDYININPAIAQNIIAEQLYQGASDTTIVDWRTRYFRNSRVTIGKYITDDLFFSYQGRIESGESTLDHREKLGIIHTWDLEYRLPTRGANLLMIVGYEYDNLEDKTDKRVSVKYTFTF